MQHQESMCWEAPTAISERFPEQELDPFDEVLLHALCEMLGAKFYRKEVNPEKAKKKPKYTAVLVGPRQACSLVESLWTHFADVIRPQKFERKFTYASQQEWFCIGAADQIRKASKGLKEHAAQVMELYVPKDEPEVVKTEMDECLQRHMEMDKARYEYYSESELKRQSFCLDEYEPGAHADGERFAQTFNLKEIFEKRANRLGNAFRAGAGLPPISMSQF